MNFFKSGSADFLNAIKGADMVQRRLLAAMARGAVVIRQPASSRIFPPGPGVYEAWIESEQTGKLTSIFTGKVDIQSLRQLLPMIQMTSHEKWGFDYFYVPGADRPAVMDLLTHSMPVPPLIQMQVEWERRHANEEEPMRVEQEARSTMSMG